jgi:sucrose-6-phosphate hydrolase SacC (GH32 family)
MHWGHAVSKDLLHWNELPVALSPDDHGTNYSGSAVFDSKNTSGLGSLGNPPLIALYTGAGSPFTQCLASSLDKGRTWKMYGNNPVLGHIVGANRDPRVFWHDPSHSWVMALYLDGDEFAIYRSSDLLSWKEASRLHLPGSSECPELFPLGDKWVFFGANYRYVIGAFDGSRFTPEQKPVQGDFGRHFYASQTWNDAPRGRRVQIAWMNAPHIEGMPFTSEMSFPSELKLRKIGDEYRVLRMPVSEISKLYDKVFVVDQFGPIPEPTGDLYDIDAAFSVKADASFEISLRGLVVCYEPGKLIVDGCEAPVSPVRGVVKLRILLDRSTLEVFANDGVVSVTNQVLPDLDRHGLSVRSLTGDVKIRSFKFRTLTSVWR